MSGFACSGSCREQISGPVDGDYGAMEKYGVIEGHILADLAVYGEFFEIPVRPVAAPGTGALVFDVIL